MGYSSGALLSNPITKLLNWVPSEPGRVVLPPNWNISYSGQVATLPNWVPSEPGRVVKPPNWKASPNSLRL